MTNAIIKCPHCYNDGTYTVKSPDSKTSEWTHLFLCPGCKEMFQALIKKIKKDK